jgi:hypothetical protein
MTLCIKDRRQGKKRKERKAVRYQLTVLLHPEKKTPHPQYVKVCMNCSACMQGKTSFGGVGFLFAVLETRLLFTYLP